MKLDKILLENNKYLIQNYQRFPIEMIKGDGSYVWDSKGKKYLDFISGIFETLFKLSSKIFSNSS